MLVDGSVQISPFAADLDVGLIDPHLRIVSWETTIPRSSSISSTIVRLKGNRKYSQTARAMICGGKRWFL
ncbi:hypothetical protein ACVIKO_000034 [Rhizobium ruizarguesonis]